MTSTVRPKTLLECDALAKVFTRNFELGRRHVFSDIFRLRARSLDRLRPEEWVAVRGFSITIHEGENVLVLGMAGSGKTTILDAVCLALYGRTPRLNRINKSTNEILAQQQH